MLDRSNAAHINVSADPRARNYAPKAFKKDRGANTIGISERDFAMALERLRTSGQIESVQYGAPSKQTFRLERNYLFGVQGKGL